MKRFGAITVALGAAMLATLGALALATPAAAEHRPALRDYVVDQADVLSGGADRAVADARQRRIDLYVVTVRTTGGGGARTYADETAAENELGGNDALLVLAIDDRRHGLWVGSGLRGVERREIDALFARDVEPELRARDYDGAVDAVSDGLVAAVRGDATRQSDGGQSSARRLLLVLVVGLGAFWMWRRYRLRREDRAAARARAEDATARAGAASAALIRADEQLRDAEMDLQLARGSFRPEDVAPLEQDVAAARDGVRAAFDARQEAEDAVDDPALWQAVLDQCAAIEQRLAGVRERVAELRDFEHNAPALLAELRSRVERLEARCASADDLLGQLRETVPESARAVDGNVVETRKRLDYARSEIRAGDDAATAGDLPTAARHARDAEQSVVRAEQLLDGVTHLDEAVTKARTQLGAVLEEATRSLTQATATAPNDERVAAAREALRQAREQRDVLAAHRLATEADALADAVAEGTAEERRVLDAALRSAEASYTAAADFVAARREGVGSDARARLRLAERELDRAHELAGRDRQAAMNAARESERYAREALELAERDFDRLESYGGAYGGGFGGFGLPIPLPIPIIIGGGGGWGGPWGSWGGGGGSMGGGWGDGGGGDSFGGGW